MRRAGGAPCAAVRGQRWRVLAVVLALAASSPQAGDVRAQQAAEGIVRRSWPLQGPQELSRRLEAIFADPALERARVGLVVQLAETGEYLFRRDEEKRFLPASNAKIITGAVALDVLGPAYRWKTRLLADGAIRDGTLEGDLWIVGGGDPGLTREKVAEWAAVLSGAGIRHISGDVVGDDRAFEAPQWGQGWMWDDVHTGWSAGVSGLQLSPAPVRAYLLPGAALGDSARFALRDWGPAPELTINVLTGAPGSELRLRYLWPPEARSGSLDGWIPLDADTVKLSLAPRHPTLFLLRHLTMVLEREDIGVQGRTRRARAEESPAEPTWSAEFPSDSLGAVLGRMLGASDNQMAESLLRTVGREAGAGASAEAGLRVAAEVLAGWGVDPGAAYLVDGSGLSRYNELTPGAVTRVLRAMWRHPDHEVFEDALPAAGFDGTMRGRLLGTPAYGNVRAKTGSLSSARALSGYLTDGTGETIVFSLMVNGYDVPGDVAVALEDLIVEQLALYRRPVEPGWPEYRTPDPGGAGEAP